jgi:hypothetical protein
MEFVVTTQGLENYGAHQGKGTFAAGEAYWKFKSGTDYLVSGLDRPQDAMAFVAAIGIENGIGWKEFPVEVKTFDEFKAEFGLLEDEFNREYFDFKMQYMKRVDPREMCK